MKDNEKGGAWGEEKCIQQFGRQVERKRPLERHGLKWEDNVKISIKVIE
jgi:hypothetical protein